MPRYFFEIKQGLNAPAANAPENEGLEFRDPRAAWAEATAACGEMIRDLNGSLQPGSSWHMKVLDENDKVIFKLAFLTEAFD